MKTFSSILIILAVIVFSALIGWKMAAPFVWIFLLYAFACIFLAVRHKKKWLRLLMINLGLTFLLLAGGEYIAKIRLHNASTPSTQTTEADNTQPTPGHTKTGTAKKPALSAYFDPNTSYSKDYYEQKIHPVLGYRVKPGITANSIKYLSNGKTLYNVTYNINSLGLRKTPQPTAKPQKSVLFFGGSFMFGEGLEDSQTIPAQTARIAAEKYNTNIQALNLGLHGYGPHQMLSIIESGYADSALAAKPTNAIYLYIDSHRQRAAGDTTWDMAGPRYITSAPATATRTGNFNTSNPFNFLFWSDSKAAMFLEKAKRHMLLKSSLYKVCKSFGKKGRHQLMQAILLTTRQRIKEKYPDCRFDIIVWNYRPEFEAFLQENEFSYHKASDIIPDLTTNKDKYILQADQHPNALADKLLGEYIAKNIISGEHRE